MRNLKSRKCTSEITKNTCIYIDVLTTGSRHVSTRGVRVRSPRQLYCSNEKQWGSIDFKRKRVKEIRNIQTNKQINRLTNRQTDGQTYRQTEKDRKTSGYWTYHYETWFVINQSTTKEKNRNILCLLKLQSISNTLIVFKVFVIIKSNLSAVMMWGRRCHYHRWCYFRRRYARGKRLRSGSALPPCRPSSWSPLQPRRSPCTRDATFYRCWSTRPWPHCRLASPSRSRAVSDQHIRLLFDTKLFKNIFNSIQFNVY